MQTQFDDMHNKSDSGPPNYYGRGFTSCLPLLPRNKYIISLYFSETTASLAASPTKNKRMTGIKEILRTNLYNCLATDNLNEGIIKDSKDESRKQCVLGNV